ncbi:MAG TPA: alpha-2-macroglobulin family protein, partial [Rhizobiales bacterium]|nr:alpha-2-macroglobulin family protein [Hyphomicrobiales bacterium]
SDYSSSQPFAGTIAGRKITAKAISGTRKPNPDPAFLSKAIRNKADTLPRRMKGWYKPQKSGFVSLRRAGVQALRAKKIVPAARFFGRALALYTDDPAVLLAYSRAISSQPNLKGKKRRLVQEVATSAALLAYRAAATPAMRAKALNTLAKMLVARKYWWSAINSYKLSLSLVHDPSIQQKLTELRENHGFRITKHDVDSDTANPRICIRFSENLKAKTDFTPFIRIDGKVPEAVKQKGSRQLCLEGVRHAASYSIDIRAGLPSSIAGETLARTVNIKAYIRDRAAAVRFTGNGFVLPRIGSEGIPVVSVNTSEIDIEIYRVDERNLTTILKNDRFGRQISPYRATRIGESSGEKIWNGKLEVAEKRNQEVTTSFPITEALPIRKPGVYVMMARPAQKKTQDEYVRATQWFVISDIGLTSFSGADGLHVFTRSLSTAQTLPHVKLRLVARNNTVLATAQSDEQGYARFAPGLIRGEGGNAPKILIAEGEKGDTVLIDLAKSAFDLSDRGVSGRAAPPPMDAYLYTERGIYRPGSAVHAVTLLRDPEARAISNIPLTLIVSRPDGVEYRRYKLKDSGQGSYMKEIPLIRSVMRGTWQIAVYSDPKKDPLAQTSILVEDFVPDRFEFDLTSPAKWLSPRQETALHLSGRYLYGAPAADLRLTGDIRILSARELPGFAGYRFGLADEEKQDDMNTLDDLPRTDAAGAATIRLRAPDLPVTTGPLKARVSIRMIEAGGRAVERAITLPVQPQAPMIGIRPLFEDKRVGEGETAKFDVLAVGRDGKTRAMGGLKWELVKLERSFQWYRSDGEWNYESVEYTKRVANGRLDVSADKAARIAAKVDWGSYRLEISGEGEGAPASSFTFSAGWYSANANADTPDFLQIALDKPAYRAGERAKVKLSPRYDGMALVTVMGERLLAMKMVSVKKGSSEVEFTVGDDWGAGAYVTATLYRPMDVARSRNPARAMGVSWLDIDNSARTLGISLDLPDKFRSGKSLNLPVSLSGLEANEEAYVTLAAVDVGILNLTRFKPPAPESWYFGQRKLGMEIRDLYGRLINGMLGVRGKIRTGSGEDEGAEMSMQGTPPAQKPVSLFSGIVKVDAHGKAVITLDVPEFNGSLRLMAVAWSKSKVGHAARDLIVRDPVVMSASLPRFLAPGDASRLLLEFNNTDGPAGIYTLDLQMPPQLGLYEQKTSWSVNLPRGGKSSLFIPFFSRQVGVGTISLRLHNADGLEITRNLKLGVRAAQPVLSTRRILPLPAQGQGAISLNANMLTGLRPETASLSLSISRIGKLDLPGLLAGLDRYPYGCTEQITSRALPLLYLGDVAKSVGLNARAPRRERIQKAIDRVLTRQDYSGGFGLWRPDSDNLWLSAYVTDFLTRAREQSYSVPVKAFERALGNLENGVSYNRKIRNQGRDIAYALYVLARNGRASLGDLRYFADSRLKAFTSPMARAQLGAAFTYFGDRARATRLFKAAMALLPSVEADPLRTDFGSRLRDVAAVMALAAQSSPPLLPPASFIQRLDQRRAETPTASTQEKAWLLLAARALLKGDENISLKVNGKTRQGHLFARYPHSALTARPLNIVNEGSAPLQAVITTTGIPARPGPASGNGFSIERKIYNLKGEEVSTASLQQTSRLIVVLEVHEDKSAKSRLLVVDRLPAGFEIDNPSLMTSASL